MMMEKRIILLLLCIVIIFTTVGCQKETFKLGIDSKFNIVFPEKEIRKYIEKARENEEDIDNIYKKIVYKPIQSEFTKDTVYPSYDFLEFQHSTKDLDSLEKQMEIFIQEDVVNLARETLEKCDNFLPSKGTTIYILPFISYDMYFDGGFTQSDGKILIYINPLINDWEKSFSNILAREYYHSVWMNRKPEKDFTTLECLLFEGQADSFADIICPNSEKPTTYPLLKIEEKEMWDEIKENLNNPNSYYQEDIMLGDCSNVPTLCGYRIGYSIMQEFIKNNPDVSVEEWANMDAKGILEKSGYDKSLEGTKSKFNIVFSKTEVKDWIKIFSNFSSEDEIEENLKNPKLFIKVENEVISFVEETLEKLDSVLPSEGATVYILTWTGNEKGIRRGWVSAENPENIWIYVNPMDDNWKCLHSGILAHEYHHSVRIEKVNLGTVGTMLDSLILEGQAETFAQMLYPDSGLKGSLTLPIAEEKKMWDKIKENLNSFDYSYQYDILYGTRREIPELCGYRIGYSIMQEFIKNNPDVSVEEWTCMDSKEILEKSGYEDSLEKRVEEYNNN